jgi:hypothetical protein
MKRREFLGVAAVGLARLKDTPSRTVRAMGTPHNTGMIIVYAGSA